MAISKYLIPTLLIFLAMGNSSRTGDINSKSIKIITSFYPIFITTKNLVQNIPSIKLSNLVKPQTGCLHDYELSPKDVKALENADILIINGAGMEAFLGKVSMQYPKLKIINASSGIPLLKNRSGENPHVWVSITLAIKQVENILKELIKYLPEDAKTMTINSQKYILDLERLKTKMHKALEKLPSRDIITFHEAFSYFASEFGLHVAAVIEREPGSEPSAKELSEIIEKVKTLKIKALFTEPQYPAKSANTIATETYSKIYTLDPAVTGPDDASAYLKIMEANLKTLEEALK